MLLVITLVLLVAGCGGQPADTPSATAATGDSKTEPTGPTGSASASPSPSPAPTTTSKEEQRAVGDATAAVRKYNAALAEVIGSPSVEKLSDLNRFVTDPWLEALQNNFLKQIDFNQRGRITRDLTSVSLVKAQMVPQDKIRVASRTSDWKPYSYRLEAPSPVVVLDTCVTSTVVKPLTKNGKKIVKDSKPGNQHFYAGQVTVTKPAHLDGRWAVAWVDVEEVPSC